MNKLESEGLIKNNKIQFLISILLTIFVGFVSTIVVKYFFSVIVISPDDVVIENILSGLYTGSPDGHCYFIRYPLSLLISKLYAIMPSTEWYFIFLFLCNVFCLLLIVLIVVKRYFFANKIHTIVAIVCIVIMVLPFIIHLEWTVTAGVLCSTAIYLFGSNINHSKLIYIISIALYLLGFCLRYTVGELFLPIAGIVYIKTLVFSYRNKRKKFYVFLYAAIIIIGLITIFLIHNKAYSSNDWQAYSSYTKDRSILFDYYGYPRFEDYVSDYNKAGISEPAYQLMKFDYNFLIPCNNFISMDIHAIATLSKTNHVINDSNLIQRIINTMIDAIVKRTTWPYFVVMILLLVRSFIISLKKDRMWFFSILTFLVFIVLNGYLSYLSRLPERVELALVIGTISALLCYESNYDNNKTQKIICFIFLIVAISALTYNMISVKENNKEKESVALNRMEILDYCQNHLENIYLRDFISFSQQGQFLSHAFYSYQVPNYIPTGGWIYNSPIYNSLEERLDIVDIDEAIINNNNIYYLVNATRVSDVIIRFNNYYSSIESPIQANIYDSFETRNGIVYVLKVSSLMDN